MGNNLCCEQQPKAQLVHTVNIVHKQQPIQTPELNPVIRNHLQKKRPFFNQLLSNPPVKKFGQDVYEGRLDERNRPNGFGKMYHKNGTIFIGQFIAGVANGRGHYVKTDGSYYEGRMRNNMANDDNGYFWSPKFEYRGSIVDNQLHGKGVQTGQNHTYEGFYEKSQKTNGRLRWKDGLNQFQYQGPFNNQGNFEGKGKLWQKGKGIYVGDFINGLKHGKGEFKFDSGLTYTGDYYRGQKDGLGKIVNKSGYIAYDGEFKNGLPNGRGKAPNQQGQFRQRFWVDGIDKMILQ